MPESSGPTIASGLLPVMRAKNVVSFARKVIPPAYKKAAKALSGMDKSTPGQVVDAQGRVAVTLASEKKQAKSKRKKK